MNVIVKTITNIVFPVIELFGLYVIIHGHMTPGGTFSGGSIMAAGFILYTLANGIVMTERELKEIIVDILKSVAGFALVVLIIFEFSLRRLFIPTESLFTLWSGGPLLFFNVIGGIMVFTGLLLIWYTVAKTDVG